jgi:hypothetical protein
VRPGGKGRGRPRAPGRRSSWGEPPTVVREWLRRSRRGVRDGWRTAVRRPFRAIAHTIVVARPRGVGDHGRDALGIPLLSAPHAAPGVAACRAGGGPGRVAHRARILPLGECLRVCGVVCHRSSMSDRTVGVCVVLHRPWSPDPLRSCSAFLSSAVPAALTKAFVRRSGSSSWPARACDGHESAAGDTRTSHAAGCVSPLWRGRCRAQPAHGDEQVLRVPPLPPSLAPRGRRAMNGVALPGNYLPRAPSQAPGNARSRRVIAARR